MGCGLTHQKSYIGHHITETSIEVLDALVLNMTSAVTSMWVRLPQLACSSKILALQQNKAATLVVKEIWTSSSENQLAKVLTCKYPSFITRSSTVAQW